MYISFCNFVVTLLFLLCTNTIAQERCFTPTNVNGVCINIRNCSPIIRILQNQKPLNPETIELLKSFQCGYEGEDPKVCCPVQPEPTKNVTQEISNIPDVSNHPNLRILNLNPCGQSIQTKILGGEATGILSFPWMALLAYNVGRRNTEFRCGGTLITKRYVLTAAHCVTSLKSGVSLVSVRLGEHDLRTERDCEMDGEVISFCADKYQDFGIESVHFNPQFSKSLQNDIALLRLDRDADLTVNNVRPICLPFLNNLTIPRQLIATGWGTTETGMQSAALLQIKLPIVENSRCKDIYQGKIGIWHKQLCAGGEKDRDSCSGDSGGPLQWPTLLGRESRYVQYGIVSFGMRNCGTSGYPGVYTNVKYYMDWILDTIRD
ncbi:PREDICTED: serine protease easter-like [Polistes dominula]|uniref:CLIP domain-containing serine protease n=1 Tax=Polistes dominula TaxID=743375 RepID=A0ABM1HT32_POLDO|nr:PREDICTED: serine protease easter-like [Polistes dominula]